jgi:2-desacetyl-2-hydroxyethyl bacteriochlorophyllide A dehydrogenase
MAIFLGASNLAIRGVQHSFPLIPGYAATGVVERVGDAVRGCKPGDRVYLGRTPGPYPGIEALWGGHVEEAIAPVGQANLIPDRVSVEEASFLGVIQPALNGVIIAPIRLGDRVAVLGQGLVGLFALQVTYLSGARSTLAVDTVDARLQRSRDLGATRAVNANLEDPIDAAMEMTSGRGVDVALDCTGSPVALADAAAMTREMGTVVIIGSYWQECPIIPFEELSARQLTLKVAGVNPLRYRPDLPPPVHRLGYQWVRDLALDLIAQGKLKVEPLITHRFPVAQCAEAFDLLASDKSALGVVLKWFDQA